MPQMSAGVPQRAVNSPTLRANYDPANFYVAGIEPYPHAYEILKEFIAYCHIKNVTVLPERRHGGPPPTEAMTDSSAGIFLGEPVGEGAINYPAIFRDMRTHFSSLTVMYEPHTPLRVREMKCLRSVDYIKMHI